MEQFWSDLVREVIKKLRIYNLINQRCSVISSAAYVVITRIWIKFSNLHTVCESYSTLNVIYFSLNIS